MLASQRQKYTKPLTVKGSFLFLSDIELPFHNAAFLNQCIAIAKAYGVKQAVWGGDAIHLEAFSPFKGADTDALKEIDEIGEALPGLLEPFDKVYWFCGNHDDRIVRMLPVKLLPSVTYELLIPKECRREFERKVTISDYYWMLADHNWQLEHAANNRVVPASTAKALAEKFRKNIIMGHTHKMGLTQDTSGRLLAIESGCCVDTERLAYANLHHSVHTAMVNGCVLMLDIDTMYRPVLLNPLVTDFEWELKQAKRKR